MGEVYKPGSLARKRVRIPDIPPEPTPPQPSPPPTLERLWIEIQELKEEILKIRRALERQGITVD
jgi:hypothetical protein